MRPKIESSRFIIRPLALDDVSVRYLSWFSDSTVQKEISSSRQFEALEDLRNYVHRKANKRDILFLGIFSKDINLHVGNIKFEPIDFNDRSAVMGILIGDESYRGKRVAKEVLEACGVWLRDNLNLTHLILTVRKDHHNAIRAYESAGFKIETPLKFKKSPEVVAMVKWL